MNQPLTCEEITNRALIERYLAGLLGETEAEALESHYLFCGRCQDELRLAIAVRGALAEVEAVGSQPPPLEGVNAADERHAPAESVRVLPIRRQRVSRRAVVTAAAALAAVLAGLIVLRPSDVGRAPVHRAETPAAEAELTLQLPAGEVATVEEFRWSPAPGANLYKVTVYDEAGAVVLEVETLETHVAPPDTTVFAPGIRFLWQVAARVGWDRWVSSELAQFRISEP
ncbi:MAG: zf-HC2 domain-containing protein [Gemmatimonadota bacterium]|nr:MAG: zf-HC2 domain-containing protein [Gemmatimonadota bacterium]